ncbi:UNVERIFIED_ORG: ATP-dependent exoDNAse (exonuclease V) beta subunit [Paraburkholderia sediminicola]|nr:ATP-dependent exoDNAse (exonuclease V) beta subunit [Paraburkholderia sediminicola]
MQLLTYHKSNGLEAHAVFLVGDCVYMKSSLYKNQTYRYAELGDPHDPAPYDTSQKHELLRLAYVAITRAARHCYWFIEPPQGDAASRPKASDHIPRSEPFFFDARGR